MTKGFDSTHPKETGIIFSTEMVKAILEGQKTVTRRLRGLKYLNRFPDGWELVREWPKQCEGGFEFYSENLRYTDIIKCPYGGVGDWLYLKETHQWVTLAEKDPWKDAAIADGTFRRMPDGSPVMMCYKADGYPIGAPWRSPLFMYKWASRKKLEIVSVRPERITAEDAKAEEISQISGHWPWVWRIEWRP